MTTTTTTTTTTATKMTVFEIPKGPVQPDIAYHPDLQNYNARTKRRLQTEFLTKKLPAGFPQQLDSPLVWEGDQLLPDEWVVVLSDADIQELDSAIANFKTTSKPLYLLSKATFPLPTLSPKLHTEAVGLFEGRGFFVLRGIPVDRYTPLDSLIAYVGISAHVGDLRGSQDPSGMVLNHIKDLRATHPHEVLGTPAYTTDKQVYHTDAGDIVSLFALEEAVEGGTSRIASSWRVYNELARTRPDLLQTLSEPWDFDGFAVDPPYSSRPLLYYTPQQKLIIQYARRHFTGFQALPRSQGIPPITEAQAEALDALHFTAERFNLGLTFRRGDIQYINNLSIFHSRDAFRDSETQKRHLLRLWLRNEDLAWDIPAGLKPYYDKVYYGLKPEEQRILLEPEVRIGFATVGPKQ